MAFNLSVKNGVAHRRDWADHAIGDRMRRRVRDAAVKPKDGNNPFNEALSFTMDEWEIFKKIRPDLFDKTIEPHVKRRRWLDFANSSIGRQFRVR